jgi:hypothetical protein
MAPGRHLAVGRVRKLVWSNGSACSATTRRRFLVGAAAIGNTRLAQELEILLGLGAAHGEAALVAALRRAVAFKRFRAADVRSILAAGTGTPQPRPAGDALVVDLPTAPTRSRDAYKITRTRDGSGA